MQECKHILVVDDESDLELLIRQKFRQKIRDNIYEFSFAANGREALEKLNENSKTDVVISDINMPEMDGLTLLEKIGQNHPLPKTVIVSAYGDMDNIRTAMNLGAFDFITKPVNFQDLELTIEKTFLYVETIKKSIQAIRENDILKMYVDHGVLNHMLSEKFESNLTHNDIIDASIAFIDICGFTSLSERESPDNVVRILNTYFDLMVGEINDQNGTIDKFIGDCVMAVFKGEFHLDRAIEASIAIRDKIKTSPSVLGFEPHVSIGVNSGDMVYGNIGAPSLKRLDFTVIGDSVNTAQRLQSHAKPDQIIIPSHCYEKIKMSFSCNSLGFINVKNKSEVLEIYEVDG
jgi:adenylate cyclase